MYYISHLVKEKKFRPVIFRGAESRMAAYIVFETGHTSRSAVHVNIHGPVLAGITLENRPSGHDLYKTKGDVSLINNFFVNEFFPIILVSLKNLLYKSAFINFR